MSVISVSSYSLRELLGPIEIAYTDEEGTAQVYRRDHPKAMDIAAVPAEAAARLGVRGVEAVAFQFGGIDDVEIDRFADGARSAGLSLINAAIDVGDLLDADAGRRAADVAELKQWIRRFADAGFRFVRVNAGSPFARPSGDRPPTTLVAALRDLGEHAQACGVRLLVENHGGPSSDPGWMSGLLDAVGSDRVGLLLDLGNFDALLEPLTTQLLDPDGSAQADPFGGVDLEPLYAGIAALAGRAELVHVKAHHVGDDGTVGPIDLPRALAILRAHGYAGPLTVEYEGEGGDPWHKTRVVVQLIADAGRAAGEENGC